MVLSYVFYTVIIYLYRTIINKSLFFSRLEFFKRDINVFSKSLKLKDSQLKEIDLACNLFLKDFRP